MRAAPEERPFATAFGAGGKELVVSENSHEVEVFSADTGAKLPGGGEAQTGGTFGLSISLDGRWAAASAPDGHVLQVFDVHTWSLRQLVAVASDREHVIPFFSPDSRLVFAQGGSRWVKGFEVGTSKPYASYHAVEGRAVGDCAADLSRVIVTADTDAAPAPRASPRPSQGPVVVTVGNATETPLERPFADADTYYHVSPDGALVAAAQAASVRVWSAKTGRVTFLLEP